MKVVDLHPEDLIDKLAASALTPTERARLDAHLAQCSVCRFEIDVRAEFDREVPALEDRPQLTFPGPSEHMPLAGAAPPRLAKSIRPRSRQRWPLALLAAALVLCAGGAMAAVLGDVLPSHWFAWVLGANRLVVTPAARSAKVASKAMRSATKPAASEPPSSLTHAGASAPSLPSAKVDQLVGSASVIASPTARANRVAKAAPVASSSARAGTNAAVASEVAPSEAVNPRVETAPRGEAPSRLDPAAALFADANRARRDGNADRAATLYRALQSRFPNSAESALSRALLAQLLLDRGSPDAALSGFDRYLASDSPVLSAEALVGRARALEQLGRPGQAAAAWREVQARFPGSVHARLAATRLVALGMR